MAGGQCGTLQVPHCLRVSTTSEKTMNHKVDKHISAQQIIFFFALFSVFSLVAFVLILPLANVARIVFSQQTEAAFSFPPRIFSIAAFTVTQALLSSILATLIGFALSYFCTKKEFRGRKFLLSLAAIPVSVPPLIIALSYVLFFGKSGVLNSFVSVFVPNAVVTKPEFLYSTFSVILIHSFYNFPIAMKTITGVWENVDADLEHAASLLSCRRFYIFSKIILPEIFPAIISSFLLIFIYCFFSFFIILLFGGIGLSTLEVELYQTFRSSTDLINTAKIAILESGIVSFFTAAYIIAKLKTYKNSVDNRRHLPRTSMNRIERCVFSVLIATVLLFLVLPIASIFFKSVFSFASTQLDTEFITRVKNFFAINVAGWSIVQRASFFRALWNTIFVGIITASFSVFTALCIIYLEFRTALKNTQSVFLKVTPFVPLVVSPIVLGFALCITFSSTGSFGFLLLSAAQASTAWTIAYTQIAARFVQISKTQLQASSLLSANSFDAFYRAVLPQLTKSIKAAAAFCFAISAGDASLPLMLKISNFENLSLMIFRLAGSYRFNESAVIAFALILLVCVGFLLSELERNDLKITT